MSERLVETVIEAVVAREALGESRRRCATLEVCVRDALQRLTKAELELAAAKLKLRRQLLRLRLRATRGHRNGERLAARQWHRRHLQAAGYKPGIVTRPEFWGPMGGPSEKWVAYLEVERAAGAAS